MESRLLKMTLVFLLFAAVAALSVPALGAENATVKGDGADLYERPYFSSPVIAHLTYGKRVEVIGWAHFPDAVEGYSAPWYRVSSGSGEGFIHGKYLAIDAGVKIPMLPTAFEIIDRSPEPEKPDTNNATITGDGVRVRRFPSTSAKAICLLNRNTRVEVTGRTDSTDTIGGDTDHWYSVECRDDGGTKRSGFVFGKFVRVDRNTTVHPTDFGNGLSIYFVEEGTDLFGKNRLDVVRKLGQPLSDTKKTYDDSTQVTSYTLVYDGVVIATNEWPGDPGCIYSVSVTTDAYEFNGVKVGCSVSDVYRLFGGDKGKPGNDGSFYYSAGREFAIFTAANGKITEIRMEHAFCGD